MVATAERTKQLDSTYGYYRQPDGWITVTLATALEELVNRNNGWEPLKQYGRVEMASAYAANHPFEALFQAGGAKELPVDQIIAMGLHLNPPLIPACEKQLNQYHKRHDEDCWPGAKPVEFPQLENPPPAVGCTFCEREFPTKAASTQHETVMHKEDKGDIRLGSALAEALNQRSEAPISYMDTAATSHLLICGSCGAGFDKMGPFQKHIDEEKLNDRKENEGTDEGPGEGTGASEGS